MKKKQTKAQKLNYQKYFPLVIFISILFMSIGYAVINYITLDVSGEVIAKNTEDVYITEVNYHSNTNANLSSSKIITAYQTMLNSEIVLSQTDVNSSITYTVKFYNSNSEPYEFTGITYIPGETTYSNESIILEYEKGSIIYANNYLSINITFKYNGTIPSDTSLLSYITFEFEKLHIYPVEYISMGYNTTINITKFSEYKTISASDIILELDYIKLPNQNSGTADITKTYNSTTGVLTLKRSAVGGSGTVNFQGNLYAIPKLKKEIASASGSTSIEIDCTSVTNYQEKTEKDFVYDVTQVVLGKKITGETTFSKEYNPETGILTITRTLVEESDGIKFTVTLYTVEQ